MLSFTVAVLLTLTVRILDSRFSKLEITVVILKVNQYYNTIYLYLQLTFTHP